MQLLCVCPNRPLNHKLWGTTFIVSGNETMSSLIVCTVFHCTVRSLCLTNIFVDGMSLPFQVLWNPECVVWDAHVKCLYLELSFGQTTVGDGCDASRMTFNYCSMKGACALEKVYTFLGRRRGNFLNAPKLEFLCIKVNFGYVGIVQNMKKGQQIC